MGQTLIVGVDPHRKRNVMQLMDSQGQVLGPPLRVANNRPGTVAFVDHVVQQMAEGEYEAIQVASEATGWYWFHFFQSLSQDPLLNQWPLELYVFNPRLTAKFKQSYSDRDKTDPNDALVVADRFRFGRDLPVPFQYEETYLPLRFLTRYYFHVTHNLAREKAYALTLIYLKASEFSHPTKKPFTNLFGAASRAVLQEFASIEEIAALDFSDLVEFIDVKGKRRFADPEDNARKLHQVVADSYPLPQALQQPLNTILALSFKHITFLEGQQKRLKTAIADHISAIPNTLQTIPGMGPVLSAGLIAEIGPLDRFDFQETKVAKLAGFMWRKTQSADFTADHTPLIKNCNRYLRYYFCEAATVVRMHDPEYKLYYDRKYHEVPKHQHKRAMVLTARKLVRLVVRLLTTNQPYRPRRT
ncbi:MAG: IS110 family transposase [Anaerolineae bacterium]|nr:IS110 family transposase [Anaerolineae bacterium]